MVLGVVFFVVTGGVLVLRPIAVRLGNYLEVLAEQKRALAQRPANADSERLLQLLETMDQRLVHLEERQAFTDALLSRAEKRELPR